LKESAPFINLLSFHTKYVTLPPVANAGGPYSGTVGISVILDGSNSVDQDGTIIDYEWDLDDDGEFYDAAGEVVEYTWTEIYSGDIRLKVTDNGNATSIATTTAIITESTECLVTFNFIDQNGDLTGNGDERVYIDNYGWKTNGEQITVEPSTTVYYRAYYAQGSGLYGPKLSQVCNTNITIDVPFYTITMDIEDQNGTLNGTGDERVYLDHVGYKAIGETVAVPLDSTVYHRAYYKEGSGLYGPKLSTNIDGTSDNLTVMYHTIIMDFEDQNGTLNGTGDERVYLDHVGYKANGETVAVPLNSTVYHRAYYKEGSGLYGPKLSTDIDGISYNLTVTFRQISFSIIDELTQDLISGAQVYVDHIGYIENGGNTVVPLMSTVYHKANIGDVWSEKTSKEVDEIWIQCIYQWDGSEFSLPSYE
jgi:sulfur carrier protein ThiS